MLCTGSAAGKPRVATHATREPSLYSAVTGFCTFGFHELFFPGRLSPSSEEQPVLTPDTLREYFGYIGPEGIKKLAGLREGMPILFEDM